MEALILFFSLPFPNRGRERVKLDENGCIWCPFEMSKSSPSHKFSKLINFVNDNGWVKVKYKPTYGLVEFHELLFRRILSITHLEAWPNIFWWNFSKLVSQTAPNSVDPDSRPKKKPSFVRNSFLAYFDQMKTPSVIHVVGKLIVSRFYQWSQNNSSSLQALQIFANIAAKALMKQQHISWVLAEMMQVH